MGRVVCQSRRNGPEIKYELLKVGTSIDPFEMPHIIPARELTFEREKYLYEKVRPYVEGEANKDELCRRPITGNYVS
jgi:hypothetical protein